MKTIKFDNRLQTFTAWISFFLITSILLYIAGPYNFCYQEQWQTFVYDGSFTHNLLAHPGGCCEWGAIFLIQFFKWPITGIIITSLLLSGIFLSSKQVFQRWVKAGHRLTLLALLLPIALAFLHFNTNYLYEGTLAFALMMLAISIQIRIKSYSQRYFYSMVSSILLFIMGGSIAMLYTLLLLIIETFNAPKKVGYYLTAPLLVILMGYICLRMGWSGEWKHLLLPDGYFTHRLPAGSSVYFPWITVIIVFIIAGLVRQKLERISNRRLCGLQVAMVVLFFFLGSSQYLSKGNEFFKELSYLARHQRWEDIIKRTQEQTKSNALYQNYLNLALAEKRILPASRKAYPAGTQSLFISGNKTPYISAMLSDIYFSMGHISFSQRYAFEANESSGNFSPKLLQRLVQTSLIYGNDALALKYIQLLEKTLFYREWAEQHRKFIGNPQLLEADPTIGNLRKCLFPDNRFAGSKGLDDDLVQILEQHPSHQSARQYLQAIQSITGIITQQP